MKNHDELCPVIKTNPWQICLCEAFALVREEERKRATFIAQHTIEDHFAKDDAIAWINGTTPTWWTDNNQK